MTQLRNRHLAGARSANSFKAFSLLEVIVAIGLVAGMTFLLIGSLAGGGKSVALQSAQATVANLVTGARTKASATNRKTRMLIHADAGQPDRFLRHLVLQIGRQPGPSPTDWDTVQTVSLAPEIYIVPGALSGLVEDASAWKRVSDPDADLVSDLFLNQTVSYRLEGDTLAQLWIGVAFTPNHTLAALGGGPPPKGSIVIASGMLRAPGTYEAGQPPVRLVKPEAVRGLVLSAYGVPALLNDRNSY